MASLHLTMTEHQYYEDIFSYCCEYADSESVPVLKVAELLRSANLPGVVTMKVHPLVTRNLSAVSFLSRRRSKYCDRAVRLSSCRSGRLIY